MAPAPLDQLRLEAAGLASDLGSLATTTRAASLSQIGSAPRRRAGTGESFWQYRRHNSEDDAQRVDWRQSAKRDKLYVRETELETARTYLFWVDPSPGFSWSSNADLPHKADRSLVLCMALAGALSRAGERCGTLGGGRSAISGAKAPARVGEDLRELGPDTGLPPPPSGFATAVVCGDFYTPIAEWDARIGALSSKCRDGILLQVTDPSEEQFDFNGRVRFSRPGVEKRRIIGKAESLRERYLEKFAERQSELDELAGRYGWQFLSHSVSEDVQVPLKQMAFHLANAGGGA